jgi:hypothetical protein
MLTGVDHHLGEARKQIYAFAMRALLAGKLKRGFHLIEGLAQFGSRHLPNYRITIVAFDVTLPVLAHEAVQEPRALDRQPPRAAAPWRSSKKGIL